MKIEDIHTCDKCKGKIVAIATDAFGNTFCGYCGRRVDYSEFNKEMMKKMKKQGLSRGRRVDG